MALLPGAPLVTIGIPNFNYGDYLGHCIESALAQDYPNIEVLVSDNGSSDHSLKVLESFRDPRLRFWRNERNVGIYPNWDLLLSRASGEYIKILPADDELSPNFVRRCIQAIQCTGSDFALTGFRAFGDQEWEVLPSSFGFEGATTVGRRAEIVAKVAAVTALVPPTPGLYRKTLVPEGYGGDASSRGRDMVYWARAVVRGQVVFLNEALAGIRVHGRQERRARDTSSALLDVYEALDLLRPFDPGTSTDHLARVVSRTYGRSLIANVARGRWGVSWRIGRILAGRRRLARGVLDAFLPCPRAPSTKADGGI